MSPALSRVSVLSLAALIAACDVTAPPVPGARGFEQRTGFIISGYVGLDVGAGPASPRPNASAAAAAFDAAASSLGPLVVEDFENAPVGLITSLALPTMTVTHAGAPGLTGVTTGNASALIEGYNTTAGGSRYIKVYPAFGAGTASLTFTPAEPLQAWGAYLTGVGTVTNTRVEIVFDDGSAQTFTVPGSSNGGVVFFGFTDPGKQIASVTVRETLLGASQRDIFSVDDVRYVLASNEPPVANAGADQTLECTGPSGCTVTLDGSGSSDPDGSIVAYEWRDAGGALVGTGAMVTTTQALGTTTYTLTVTDDAGDTSSDQVTITVEDTTAPDLSISATPGNLWPANHQLQPITLNVAASDICDANVTVTATAVSSDPDDASGNGDGNTAGDIQAGAQSSSNASPTVTFNPMIDALSLRAERSPQNAGGRVYTIVVTATDASGNSTSQTVTVVVPHDRR